jgi:hypothetical protein
LNTGPDGFRLSGVGDFIVEIPFDGLDPGANTVVITAVDTLGEQTDKSVTMNYTPGAWWDLPLTADFTSASKITDVAHVVTGSWWLTLQGVRTQPGRTGYDRLLVIGEQTWITDYEATGTVTIHDGNLGGIAGIGYIVGWQGHEGLEQPRIDPPFQAAGWIRDIPGSPVLELRDDEVVRAQTSMAIALETTYVLKLRSQYLSPGQRQVSVKLWEEGSPEPAWQLSEQFAARDGSLLLVAHMADVTFGPVTVTPLSTFPAHVLDVDIVGSGTVDVSPDQPSYLDGTEVTMTAVADSGWVFAGWSGGLSGMTNPYPVTMVSDTSVTATFLQNDFTLDVAVVGNGAVVKNPDKPSYSFGETVVLSATPDSGWWFCGYTGDFESTELVDTVMVTGNTSVEATFGVYPLDVQISGAGSVTVTPDKSFYVPGEQVVLLAQADPGNAFDTWSGDLNGGANPDTITVDSTMSVTATFVDSPTGIGDAPALTQLSLRHNAPNPFTSGTFLNYGLPSSADVEIEVYDAAGRRVYSERLSGVGAGWHQLYFDGRDSGGRRLPSGVYFYRVSTPYSSVSRKMVVVR